MEYTAAKLGTIYLIKFSDGDILRKEIERFARKERIRTAVFVFLGALKEGSLVTGPKKASIPPVANWKSFRGGWEALGVGTIFTNSSGPQIHIHTAMGKKHTALTGCLRRDSSVFLVIEAVVFELKGVKATKSLDPKTGLNLLKVYASHA